MLRAVPRGAKPWCLLTCMASHWDCKTLLNGESPRLKNLCPLSHREAATFGAALEPHSGGEPDLAPKAAVGDMIFSPGGRGQSSVGKGHLGHWEANGCAGGGRATNYRRPI